jgi:predicted DCC family thiol-disulfide oxidoreductase YuxK
MLDHQMNPDQMDSMALVESNRAHVRSGAVIRVSRHLGGIWPLFMGLLIIPAFVRDFFYDRVARSRYRWFGKRQTCRLPTPEEKSRFLD